MERKRGRHQPDPLSDLAGRETFGSGLDQKPENRQSMLVGKGRQGLDDRECLHAPYDNTSIIEM